MERIGRYEVIGELARGGMGAVYRGRDPQRDCDVAIKLLLTPERSAKRFEHEARALSKVDDPGVVRVLDHDVTDRQRPYLVMELIEGESLAARLRRVGQLDALRAVQLTIQLCRAVAACHAAGVLHRDLKPDNVLLTPDGRVKLTDFGLVLDTDPDLGSSRLTAEGNPLGSPTFWAPEQAAGDLAAIGPATDVYGLGGTLFAMLTGAEPHQGDTLMKLLGSVREAKPAPSSLNPDVPKWLDRVVQTALATDPAERYAGPAELEQALQAGLRRGPSRAPRLIGLAVVVALGVGVGARVASRAQPSPSPPPAPPALDAEGLFERGRLHVEAGQLEAAQADFEAALELDPALHRALGGLAVIQLTREDYARARDLVDRAIALDPDYVQGYQLRAAILCGLEEWELALADAARAIELDPNDPAPHFSRGMALRRLGRFGPAVVAFDRALRLGYQQPGLEELIADTLLQAGWPERATVVYARRLACHPYNRRLQEKVRRAIEAKESLFERITQLGIAGDEAYAAKDYAQAEALYTEILALRPGLLNALLQRSRARNHAGNPRGGIADCEAVMRVDPNNPVAYVNRGACFAALRQLVDARADFLRALELDPSYDQARRNLQLVERELGRDR